MEFADKGMNHELAQIEYSPPEDEASGDLLPNEIQLPRFSHLPPASIIGCKQWPPSLEAQSFPTNTTPILNDVLIWVAPYLELEDNKKLKCTGKLFQRGPGFGPLWFTRPWSPHQRRRWGFGIPSSN